MNGYIHSIESFGTVDGPGIRMVVFLQGCPMRCLYCHNPDTWSTSGGTEMSVDDILSQYEHAKHFYTHGGITVTGGEPLMQTEFVTELFMACSEKGIHTCLDTSGITYNPGNDTSMKAMNRLMSYTDLVLLDIKHIDDSEHKKLTSHSNKRILEFARYLDSKKIPVWIRHVVVPGITQNDKYLYELGQFIGTLHNVRALDVLAYHDMGKAKYKMLGMAYALADTKPLTADEAAKARQIILSGIYDSHKIVQSK